MAATDSDMIMSAIMVIFGLIISGAGLLMLVTARKLVRGEISRKGYMGRGIKIKEALASDEAWYRINREGGRLMIVPSEALMVCGIALALGPFIAPSLEEAIFVVTISWILLMA
ncbi:MAG TPA: SdpI family protein, partial [Methanocella sp.]